MKQPSSASSFNSRARRLAPGFALGVAALITASPAQAAFHLWTIRELYSDASGSLQFIELFCPANGQTVLGGRSITVTPTGGGAANTFTLPSNVSSSLNRAFLLGTAGIQGAGGAAPDAVIPANFLFSSGGTITFFGTQSPVAYSALPTDGVLSRTVVGNLNAANSPQNFAGATGIVVVPEPATLGLFAAGGLGLWCFLRRRSA